MSRPVSDGVSTAAGEAHVPDPPPEAVLAGLDLDVHLRNPTIKQRYVTVMFDVIARRYDRFTRLFSYGMDARWKRDLLRALGDQEEVALVVDLACGTGDLAFGAAVLQPSARVLALDVSRPMLRIAAGRAGNGRVAVAAADMVALPVADRGADAVTVGYGVRNAPTPDVALREVARALRPGGLLLVLDFYRPRSRLWRALFLAYLGVAGRLVGWWWHRIPAAYGYIEPSVRSYLTAEEMTDTLTRHGFRVERVRRRLLGGIALHVARRS
jgi:demethylmenaquinone methyltransferase/2-methoxy-6-polyprenyl-1,4-benzoquinol methylase